MKTWTGDSGKTRLFCGEAFKDSPRVGVCGDIDELNSFVGLARASIGSEKIAYILEWVQRDLFAIGAEIAMHPGGRLHEDRVKKLEETVHEIEDGLPELKRFILPSGAAPVLHVCRSVCRRAERSAVALRKTEPVSDGAVKYLNRLSTLFFDLARLAGMEAGLQEEEWNNDTA